jgi:hypothetical protein
MAKEGGGMTDDERRKLVSTETSLGMEPEPKMPTAMAGLETFSLADPRGEDDEAEEDTRDVSDADSFFNLPEDGEDAGDEDK